MQTEADACSGGPPTTETISQNDSARGIATRETERPARTPISPHMRRTQFILALAVFCVIAPCARAQGFGNMGKKKIVLHRKLPPMMHFSSGTFTVKASARDPKNTDISGSLKDLLETELLKNNDRLKTDNSSPELVITCNVTTFEVPPLQPFTRTEVVLEKGKQIEQPVKYNKITGTLEISYQAKDAHTGRALDADNVSAKYSEDFEAGANQQGGKSLGTKMIDPFKRAAGKKTENSSGPPSPAELRDQLIHQAVHEIASRITVTDEPVDIMLAQGKFDKPNKIAENGLWTRYLEELEQMSPLAAPKDDAYRLYNIGVAYEALAYQSEDREAAKKFLQESAINYGKAVDAKPEEKYFLEPQKRIETAMAYYRKLEEPKKSVSSATLASATPPSGALASTSKPTKTNSTKGATGSATKSSSSSTAAAPAIGTSASGTSTAKPGTPAAAAAITNDQIIKMFKAGVDEDSIISTIHDAPVAGFDLTPDGIIALANGGVKGKIVAAMRARAKLPNKRSGASSN